MTNLQKGAGKPLHGFFTMINVFILRIAFLSLYVELPIQGKLLSTEQIIV